MPVDLIYFQRLQTFLRKSLTLPYRDSAQLKFIREAPLIPVGYVKHRNPMMKKRVINNYTMEGREAIHKMLGKSIDSHILHYLMRNPIPFRTTAYNDNRISLLTLSETELRDLTDSTLDKLAGMSDAEFDALELEPDFI